MESLNPANGKNLLRQLPPVNAVLADSSLKALLEKRGHTAVRNAVRAALEEARTALLEGHPVVVDARSLAGRSRTILENRSGALRPVINATGILLHTGLGRAPLAEEAIEAVAEVARGYCNLEFDLDGGTRGLRTSRISGLLRELIGAETATAVNNNAGATVLALRALAAGREVIVSRGQLVEIGGSFRLPEIFEASGAILREVGTTNITRLSDYARAVHPETAAILRVHRSNFRLIGFAEDAELSGLVGLARQKGLWMIDDIGSGALARGAPPYDGDEPTAADSIREGADIVLFSGDKLLGGPQCGIMAGSERAVRRVESDPLMRALRLDKMTLAALEATLSLACDRETAADRIPLWSMVSAPLARLAARAERIAALFRVDCALVAEVVEAESYLGGGSAPVRPIPTMAIAISPPFPGESSSATGFAQALRRGDPPVIARVHKGRVCFDMRTIAEDREADMLDVVRQVCHDRSSRASSNGPHTSA